MSDDDSHVTRRELEQFRSHVDERFDDTAKFVEERFRAHRSQMLLYIGVAVGLIRLDLPTSVTAAAIFAMVVKGAVAFTGWRL